MKGLRSITTGICRRGRVWDQALLLPLDCLMVCMPSKGRWSPRRRLAREAIHVEQDMIKENVGCQDQTLAAYGGFNLIEFGGTNHLRVQPLTIPAEKLNLLQDHLMLFFTGFSRTCFGHRQDADREYPPKKSGIGPHA